MYLHKNFHIQLNCEFVRSKEARNQMFRNISWERISRAFRPSTWISKIRKIESGNWWFVFIRISIYNHISGVFGQLVSSISEFSGNFNLIYNTPSLNYYRKIGGKPQFGNTSLTRRRRRTTRPTRTNSSVGETRNSRGRSLSKHIWDPTTFSPGSGGQLRCNLWVTQPRTRSQTFLASWYEI